MGRAHPRLEKEARPDLFRRGRSPGRAAEGIRTGARQAKKEAKMHRNYQIKYCDALYLAEERAANDLFNEAKNIQTEMLNAINDDLSGTLAAARVMRRAA